MDPNETLRLIRLTIKQMRVDEDPGVREAHAQEIAEYFEALDEWLSRGGFLPDQWRLSYVDTMRVPEPLSPEAWREGPDAFGEERVAQVMAENDDDPEFDRHSALAAIEAQRIGEDAGPLSITELRHALSIAEREGYPVAKDLRAELNRRVM